MADKPKDKSDDRKVKILIAPVKLYSDGSVVMVGKPKIVEGKPNTDTEKKSPSS